MMKQMSVLNSEVSMVSALRDTNENEMDGLVEGILDSLKKNN